MPAVAYVEAGAGSVKRVRAARGLLVRRIGMVRVDGGVMMNAQFLRRFMP